MECHGDDLCTLQELSDSNLLSCLESRHRKGIHHAHIGRNISLFMSPSTLTMPSLANRLATTILHDLCSGNDDQCLLLYGSKSAHKITVFQSVAASLLSQASSHNTEPLLAALQLLSLLTTRGGLAEGTLVMSLFVDTVNMKSLGGHFSSILLNTAYLNSFEVLTHNDIVAVKLEELGMSLRLRDDYLALLRSVKLLLEGKDASSELGVQLHTQSGLMLAKQLYSYLVSWTVNWLNSDLAPPPTETPHQVLCVNHPSVWADAHHHSLTHLLAGYCSEALHNLYCHRLFVWEQDQYMEEGVEWETVPVEFNQTLIDTFHKADGLLYSVGLDSTEQIMRALASCCETSGDTCYESDSDMFVVSHFTGEQSYVVTDNWPIINNLHFVSPDLTHLLQTSSNSVLCDLAKMMVNSSSDICPSDHTHSLTSQARECMQALCEEVTFCQPHFVVTLDTGEEDGVFDSAHMLTQLQYLRLLDTALIQSGGYPVRMSHDKFFSSYSSLLIDRSPEQSTVEKCKALVQAANLEDCLVGTHQVLLKPWHLDQLQDALSVVQTSARKIQQAFRRSLKRRNSESLRMEMTLNIIHDSDEDSNSSSSTPTLATDVNSEIPLVIPPNSPASQPHPPLPACPHITPSLMSPSQASPASPKSPAKSGHTGAKKRSWGKDPRQSGPQSAAIPSSPIHKDHISYNWYHGMISRSDAEKALKSINCNCFLIRESQNRQGEYSLTLTHRGKVKHFRIDTKLGNKTRYELFGARRSFLTLSELVEYYSQHCLSADGELLSNPCPKDGSCDDDCPPPLPPPRKTNFSSIRRPQQSIRKLHNRPKLSQHSNTVEVLNSTHPPLIRRPQSVDLFTADISDESITLLQKELDIEERIMEAARRLAEMPCNKKERQRRKQSLQEARSRLLLLRQQYHTVQERRRFIELSMQNIAIPSNRRVSMPLPPIPPRS